MTNKYVFTDDCTGVSRRKEISGLLSINGQHSHGEKIYFARRRSSLRFSRFSTSIFGKPIASSKNLSSFNFGELEKRRTTYLGTKICLTNNRSVSYPIVFPHRIVYKFFEPVCARLDERPYKNEKHLEILGGLPLKISTISLFNSVFFLRRAIRDASDKERNSRINN